MKLTLTNGVGYLSTLCICATLLPQICQIVHTHNVAGLSLGTYLIYDVGNLAGLVYGVRSASRPVIATSAITLLTSAYVTALILLY